MSLRKRTLPAGWYPMDSGSVSRQISMWAGTVPEEQKRAEAGIVPHAGWFFSGELACRVIQMLDCQADTIVVVGGHLPGGAGLLAAEEDAYETPLGPISADRELLGQLEVSLRIKPDRYNDNTVEVQLPLVKHFFPDAQALWLRPEHSPLACDLGRSLKNASEKLSKKIVVIGSTDLTHYGGNYSFSPAGAGEKAVSWVKEVNDRKIIDAFLDMDCSEVLALSHRDRSACSAGGAASAITYAEEMGVVSGTLIGYRTSFDIQPAESFVGYAGVVYNR